MSNKLNQLKEVRNAMSIALMDTRAILAAIEALFANSAVAFDEQKGLPGHSIHTLVILALEKASEADSLSDEMDERLSHFSNAAREYGFGAV